MALEIPDNIDIDEEKIQIDGEWYSVDDLKAKIQKKVEGGDFDVADLSMSLKQLEPVVSSLKEVSVKVTLTIPKSPTPIAQHSVDGRESSAVDHVVTTVEEHHPARSV